MKYRGDNEDEVLVVYLVTGGVVRCKVRFLAQHLVVMRADYYNRLIVRVVEVYDERCTSFIKYNKMH
jgi:hypothetical protein